MKKWIFSLALTLTTLSLNAFQEDLKKTIPEKIMELHSISDSSVVEIKGEKLYLNPDRLSFSEDGITLNTDFLGPVVLSHVVHDKDGFRLSFAVYRCNSCGRHYSSQPSECSCGSKDFSVVDVLPD